MQTDIRDITIVGAGPVGLFGAFYAGMRGASCRILDALVEPGGQLTALYPEKYIYDVGGFPKILAKDLVKGLVAQAMQFGPDLRLGEEAVRLDREEAAGRPVFALATASGTWRSRALVLTAGIGAFAPRRLPIDDYDRWLGRGVFDKVTDPRRFAGRRVLLVGGGDSAFDWAVNLEAAGAKVLMIHRRDGFRAHQATIDQVQRLDAEGRLALRTFREVRALHAGAGGRLEAATIVDTRTKVEERVAVDAVIPQLGYVSNLGEIANWGLELERDEVVVDRLMATRVSGIWAAGDIVTYPGKLKLIATGFGEVCVAVNQAVHFADPAKKVDPGHSSNMDDRFAKPNG